MVSYALIRRGRLDGTYVFTASHGYIDVMRSFETTFNLIINLRGSLAQVCPLFRVVQEAVLIGALSSPYNSSRGTRWIESGVRFVAFVCVSKLAMNRGTQL